MLRDFIKRLDSEGKLVKVKKPVSTDCEIANVLAALDGRPVLFENVIGSEMKVVGGLCSTRDLVAEALETRKEELLKRMVGAIENLKPPALVERAPCQEVVEKNVDLDRLPILKYMARDGGRYIPSAIAVVEDPALGRNVSFHRLMQTGKDRFTARIIENRGTDTFLKKAGGELDVAFCIGNSTATMLAAATSLPMGTDEFGMANALEPTGLVKCRTIDVSVPADSEIILEGRITRERGKEGPFLDLTETYDRMREQPVIEIKCITRRKDAIFQALLPGMLEHKNLMGMPREPTMFGEVSRVCDCRNVLITPGGSSWLHAVVQIKKRSDDDGAKAIEAAFRGHSSLKHCVVVDEDIDIYNPNDVEWAIATRVQADKDVLVKPNQPGSSLDPSGDLSEGKKAMTCKAGIDATIPWEKKDKSFVRERYPAVDLRKYL